MKKLDAPVWRAMLRSIDGRVAREMADNVIVIVIRPMVLELVFENGSRMRAEDILDRRLCPLPANDCFIEYPATSKVPAFGILVRERRWPSDMKINSDGLTHQVMFVTHAHATQNEDGEEMGPGVAVTLVMEWSRLEDGSEGPTTNNGLKLLHDPNNRTQPLQDKRLSAIPICENYEEQASFVGGLLVHTSALLAVRGVTTVESGVVKEKRVVRVRGGYEARVRYQVVDINIDEMGEAQENSNDGAGLGRALHHVRGHLRLTEKSGLVPVRPHWRGNIALGLLRRDLQIGRDEEMQ